MTKEDTQAKIVSHDPWLDLVQQSANTDVPLEQVLNELHVPARETGAVKDELMEQVIRILEPAGRD